MGRFKNIDASLSEAIRGLYASNDDARKCLGRWAEATKPASRTSVDVMVKWFPEIPRLRLVHVLRTLAGMGCGRFIVGRQGAPSRIVWTVDRIELGKAASGFGPGASNPAGRGGAIGDENGSAQVEGVRVGPDALGEMRRYEFPLRHRAFVSFELPLDLSPMEAARLADFIRSLAVQP